MNVARLVTILLMIIAGGVALLLEDALQSFNILLSIGAGTGLLFMLRWFWWRINAYSEITAMTVSFLVAVYFQFFAGDAWSESQKLVWGVAITTLSWIMVSMLTPRESLEVLEKFYRLIRPLGPGWSRIRRQLATKADDLPREVGMTGGILAAFLGCLMVYGALFGSGYLLYGRTILGLMLYGGAVVSAVLLAKVWSGTKDLG